MMCPDLSWPKCKEIDALELSNGHGSREMEELVEHFSCRHQGPIPTPRIHVGKAQDGISGNTSAGEAETGGFLVLVH